MIGARRLADQVVQPVIRSLRTFGFHLAALDVRQNSRFHNLALGQLLSAAGSAEHNVIEWSEARRLALLEAELDSPRPFTRAEASVGPEADAVPGACRAIAAEVRTNGPAGVGALIVSMTCSVADLLVVYLFARETGLLIDTYILSNAATSIAIADPEVMGRYADLVEDPILRTAMLQRIRAEYERTERMLEPVYGAPLAVRRPNVHVMVQARSAGLRVLHRQQIALLRRWRGSAANDRADAATLVPQLLLTINAIAGGLGATG
ncbi:MAG: phosphoenolpyruvate carboxylase [Chloroflexi bacterium]|nr:phosphoenolpyruvate carboxylase [Chloroflexota bacterium]